MTAVLSRQNMEDLQLDWFISGRLFRLVRHERKFVKFININKS